MRDMLIDCMCACIYIYHIDNLLVASVSTVGAGVLYYAGSTALHPGASASSHSI